MELILRSFVMERAAFLPRLCKKERRSAKQCRNLSCFRVQLQITVGLALVSLQQQQRHSIRQVFVGEYYSTTEQIAVALKTDLTLYVFKQQLAS